MAGAEMEVKNMAHLESSKEARILIALEMILMSKTFINAHRSRRLLIFLVRNSIAGLHKELSEFNIGIKVFDRDSSTYYPSNDPIVRVQVGRLRHRLKNYYSTCGADANIIITIPAGSYLALISEQGNEYLFGRANPSNGLLAISFLKCLSYTADVNIFTHGLNEEIKRHLFKQMGEIILLELSFSTHRIENMESVLETLRSIGVTYLLEGSLKIDAECMRTSTRMVETATGRTVWSEKFDRQVLFSIRNQENLALSICGSLKAWFLAEHPLVMAHEFNP